jgi:hypothetical protein
MIEAYNSGINRQWEKVQMVGDIWGRTMAWFIGTGAVIGLILGAVSGFIDAGIGGAIAYGAGCTILGAIFGFIVVMAILLFIEAMPVIFWLAIIGAVIWIVHLLWGVGKP